MCVCGLETAGSRVGGQRVVCVCGLETAGSGVGGQRVVGGRQSTAVSQLVSMTLYDGDTSASATRPDVSDTLPPATHTDTLPPATHRQTGAARVTLPTRASEASEHWGVSWAYGRMKLPGFGLSRGTKRHQNNLSHTHITHTHTHTSI